MAINIEEETKEQKLERALKQVASILEDYINQNNELLKEKIKFERKYTPRIHKIICDMLQSFIKSHCFNNKELYEKLKVPESSQNSYKLREYIIKPSLAEINAKTSLLVKYNVDTIKKTTLFVVDTKETSVADRETIKKIINIIKTVGR